MPCSLPPLLGTSFVLLLLLHRLTDPSCQAKQLGELDDSFSLSPSLCVCATVQERMFCKTDGVDKS